MPVTFGHVFAVGDVPAGATLHAVDGNGSPLPLQVDAKATHGDGSLRHAILSTMIPNLDASGSTTVTLGVGTPASTGASLALSDLLDSGFDATISVTLDSGTYSLSARDLLVAGGAMSWLSGPVVGEWIVGDWLKDGQANPHAHLQGFFHVRYFLGMAEGNEQYRFYDYFMSWSLGDVVALGFEEAIPLRNYKLGFVIGLMGVESNEYCFQFAPQYTWAVGPGGSDTFYPDYATVYANTAPSAAASGVACGSAEMATWMSENLRGGGYVQGQTVGGQDSATYYFANLQIAIAAAADSGLPGGWTAWERGHLSGIHPDYSEAPQFAVIPHSTAP